MIHLKFNLIHYGTSYYCMYLLNCHINGTTLDVTDSDPASGSTEAKEGEEDTSEVPSGLKEWPELGSV